MDKKLRKISGVVFMGVLVTGMVGGILLPDKVLSETERRKLAQFPAFSLESIFENDYSDKLETYLLEQFPGRDIFRTMKTEFDTLILGRTDSNGYMKIGNHLFEIRTAYDSQQVQKAAEKFQNIVTTYFKDSNAYYGVIPDKNYFVEEVPKYSYDEVDEILAQSFPSGVAIDLWDSVSLSDYYDTDLHAKQEALIPLANQLLDAMGNSTCQREDFEQVLATDTFYGGYSANSAFHVSPDALYYMDNKIIQNATVYDYETSTTGPVYTLDKLEGVDGYDMYLGGARALLTMYNTQVENGKKLIIFRDSFSSSISPLLLSEYEEITLVDLRYVSVDYAMKLLEDKGVTMDYDDVLFLYQVQLLYNSNSMK